MNYTNLHHLLDRYEHDILWLNDCERDEKFKWHAVQRFQNEWFAQDAESRPFTELFTQAIKGSSVLINNSTTQPANGVIKLAEKAPEEVERLFKDVLFAEDDDLEIRQQHMDEFIDGMEELLQKYYPSSWKYRQDRHAVSCYLALYAPDKNYIYKYSPVEAFAQYTEFGKDIGSGNSFNLAHYYELGDIIVGALKEHPDLLKKHSELLDDTYYKDDSLHLLAFDIIYCANTYGFFNGMQHKSKKEAIKHYTLEQLKREEDAQRQALKASLESQIRELNTLLDEYRTISLVGIQVNQKAYGTGTVIAQDINTIRVQFGVTEKQYIISTKYPMRPTFENDLEIVAAMTDYEIKTKELESLKKKLITL